MLRDAEPVSLPIHLAVDYDDPLGVDCDQAPGDIGTFVVPYKCEVDHAQLVVTEECAGSTSTPVVAFDKRPTAGSDTDRGAADIANFVCSTTAAGKCLYDEAGKGTVLEPGEEVVVELVTAAVGTPTGHFIPQLLVWALPEVFGNLSAMVETA